MMPYFKIDEEYGRWLALSDEEVRTHEKWINGPGWFAPAAECPDCGNYGMPCLGPHGAD
jgi:hypothetical protein